MRLTVLRDDIMRVRGALHIGTIAYFTRVSTRWFSGESTYSRTRPSRMATVEAAVREDTCSLPRMFET